MSLLTRNMQICNRMEAQTRADGEGGVKTIWKESGVFRAALVLSDSTPSEVAEQDTVKENFTVTTERAVTLSFGDVFRCGEKTYRIVSNPKSTPNGAGLHLAQVTAERWDLPK